MTSSDAERNSLLGRIYNINENTFDTVAMDLWRYQYHYNGLYRAYCHLMGKTLDSVGKTDEIPFLPIQFFKEHEVTTGEWLPETIFKSSGTTGDHQSQHLIRDLNWYHQITVKCFHDTFGNPGEYVWLALLPSYLERPDSSLISMVNHFFSLHPKGEGGFYASVTEAFIRKLHELSIANSKTILIGVSFALVDLFDSLGIPVWENLTVIETGGMKGRRDEMTRDELHDALRKNYPRIKIVSEYGMTELLSQAYLKEKHFQPSATMKVYSRDISDPVSILKGSVRGALNIMDLANLDTCCFISTDDACIVYEDGSFDVTGRLDQSDIRGCNLMYS